MKKIFALGLIIGGSLLVTACGSSEMVVSCTYSDDFRNEENTVKITYEEDMIVSAEFTFASDSGFDQDYADAVCEAYSGNEGLDCTAEVTNPDTDEVRSVYNITVDNHDSTLAFLEFREDVTAETYEDMKEAFEAKEYTCE